MNRSVREKIKKSKTCIALYERVNYFQKYCEVTGLSVLYSLRVLFRKFGFSGYTNMKKYCGIHEGETCVIVGTGPSLKIDDLNRISKYISFSCNGIIDIFSQTRWRPTYYAIQDPKAYLAYRERIHSDDFSQIFISDWIKNNNICIHDDVEVFPLDFYYNMWSGYYGKSTTKARVSDDLSIVCYDGFTIVYSLIQLAMYMGFSKIFLYGCDCMYVKGSTSNYFDGSKFVYNYNKDYGIEMLASYESMSEYLKCHDNIQVINVTRGGALECFPRFPIDKI